jgi:hypothetical protein
MRGAASRKLSEEPEPEPPLRAADLTAKADAAMGRLTALIERWSLSPADRAAHTEAVLLELHLEELRGQLADYVATGYTVDLLNAEQLRAAREAGIAEGLAQCPARPRARHARGSRGFRVIAGTVATGAVAASVAGAATGAFPMLDSANVRQAAGARPAVTFQVPDSATLIPGAYPSPSSSPKGATAVKSAKPVPSAPAPSRPGPPAVNSPDPSQAPPPPQAEAPALDVPGTLDLGASIMGKLVITAGDQAVQWTITTTDGITVNGSQKLQGILTAGQELDLQVTVSRRGLIYVSAGPQTWPVWVTSDLAVPAAP